MALKDPVPTNVPTQPINPDQIDTESVQWWTVILTNVLGVVGLILAIFHPGFRMPSNVQSIVGLGAFLAVAIVNAVHARNQTLANVAKMGYRVGYRQHLDNLNHDVTMNSTLAAPPKPARTPHTP